MILQALRKWYWCLVFVFIVPLVYIYSFRMPLRVHAGGRTVPSNLHGVRLIVHGPGIRLPSGRNISGVKYIPYNWTSDEYRDKQKLFKCPQLTWEVPDGNFILEDDKTEYFTTIGNLICAKHGTNINISTSKQCVCKGGWQGEHCSIPDVVVASNLRNQDVLKPRNNPRRIIQAFPFNMEFNMLEARFAEVGDIVDVFMILESNYTAYGDPKDLYLLQRLRKGHFNNVACKILHIFLPYFPPEAYSNGWAADDLTRNYIVSHGVAHQLSGYRHDDIFILNDADEVPNRDTILFLKLHDGYSEPFGFNYQLNSFGFFWKPQPNALTHIYAGVTMGMLMHVYFRKAIRIRAGSHFLQREGLNDLNLYRQHSNVSVHLWEFGTAENPGGYHCSWCCEPECIRNKLVSAQNGDFPRWGDYPEKHSLDYIITLIRDGMWFDNKSKFFKVEFANDTKYAPAYFLRNSDRFQKLLINPFVREQSTRTTSVKSKIPTTWHQMYS